MTTRRPFLTRFARARRGVAIVEFAFIAPLLILFYVGMAELCQVLLAERKSSHAASTIADLIAQKQTITTTEINGILDISEVMLKPYATGTNLKLRVTSVRVESDGTPKVRWSEPENWTDRADGSVVTLPKIDGKDLIDKGQSVIVSEIEYKFKTPFSDVFLGIRKYIGGASATASVNPGYTFKSTYYLRPRRSDEVAKT